MSQYGLHLAAVFLVITLVMIAIRWRGMAHAKSQAREQLQALRPNGTFDYVLIGQGMPEAIDERRTDWDDIPAYLVHDEVGLGLWGVAPFRQYAWYEWGLVSDVYLGQVERMSQRQADALVCVMTDGFELRVRLRGGRVRTRRLRMHVAEVAAAAGVDP